MAGDIGGKKIMVRRILNILSILLVCLFCVSLFKHISYPLFWSDEGETAMFGSRILEYGFPKVHDGKNIVYESPVGMETGVHKKWDAYLSGSWLTYYFAAVGVFFAELVEDLYWKTAIIRFFFACAGFLGLALLAWSLAGLFQSGSVSRALFLAAFVFFGLISVSLVLHLREVRHYPLMMLLSACIIRVYMDFHVFKRTSFKKYAVLLMVLLFLIFHAFYPLYFIFLATLAIFEFFSSFKKSFFWRHALLLLGSLFTALPFIYFFRIQEISRILSERCGFGWGRYWENLVFLAGFFAKYEFLYLALFVKAAQGLLRYLHSREAGELAGDARRKLLASDFLSLFFIVHLLVAARAPWVFTRYVIVLQPILTAILLLDVFLIFYFLDLLVSPGAIARFKKGLALLLVLGFCLNSRHKLEPLAGHVHELLYPYKGPLDFAIPYILENYKDTGKLVIAANYEENSLMYYLGAKVIIGFVKNNLEEDLKETPDAMIFRKYWERDPWELQFFLEKVGYGKIVFPVLDYPVNNMPDLHYGVRHLFHTPLARNESDRLEIYVKEREAASGK